jgi:hypothetical protein
MLLAALLSLAVAVSPASSPLPAQADAAAPVDQYFGPFKYSPLSVRLGIDKLARAYHARYKTDHDVIHEAVNLENALRLWRHDYPRDPWLAPTAYHLAQLYEDVQTPEARKHATAMLRFVNQYFAPSRYGHDARVRLASGFPPLRAESPVRPSPPPYAAVRAASPAASPAPITSPAGTGVSSAPPIP